MPEQTSLNDLFDELEKCTVGIKVNDSINGTGIIVSEDGLILTCYHVVANGDSKISSSDNIKVILSGQEPSPEKPVTFEQDKSNAVLDVAFLKLAEKFDNSGVARLNKSRNSFGHTFYSKGFRKPHVSESGLSAKGEIRELVRSPDNISRLQINCSDEISGGMSGSAVLDINTGNVVGMISLHYKRSDERTLNFAIPVESIIAVYPQIKEKNPGLQEISQSYEKIVKYIEYVKKENDRYTDILGRKLQEYYVEQDAIFIDKDGDKYWTREDIRSELSKEGNYKDKVKKIIEMELLVKQGESLNYYLLVGAPFGEGCTTLARWLTHSYAEEYSFDEFNMNDKSSTRDYSNELKCIPILLPLTKGSSLTSPIYGQHPVSYVLNMINSAPEKPARILLIVDGIDHLHSDQIEDFMKEIYKYYNESRGSLRVILLSKLVPLPPSLTKERVVRINRFDDQQAREYFRKAGLEKDYEKLKKSYTEALVTKPLFASMICRIHRDGAANHPVIKEEWSKLKQNALVYMYFFSHIGKSNYPDDRDSEREARRSWFRVLRAIAAFRHISKSEDITFHGLAEKLKQIKIEVDESLNITSKENLEPIIVETEDEQVNFSHQSFKYYLVATFYIESLLSYSSSNNDNDNHNAKENYLNLYNLNIGFEKADTSKIIDFLEGLLEVLLDESDIYIYADGAIDLRDTFGYNEKSRQKISRILVDNTKKILCDYYRLIADIGDALEKNPWLKKWYENEKKTLETPDSFKIGNLWIHLWISLFINNKLKPGLKVKSIKDLDQILVLSSNRIPSDLKRMKGIDLSGTELSGIDLFRADMSPGVITQDEKLHTNFENAKLRGANLCEAKLIEANLMHSDLSNAKLFNATMYGVDLSHATLLRADLSGIQLKPPDEEPQKEIYREAKFCNANLGDANISDAKMKGVDLTDADLYRANLCDSDLSEAKLVRTKLTFANLSYAKLRGADIEKPNFSYANLAEADLVGLDFSSCFQKDKGDKFANVNLSGARIYQAKPRNDLSGYRSSPRINPPISAELARTFPDDGENAVSVSTYIIARFNKSISELSTDGNYSFNVSKSCVFDDLYNNNNHHRRQLVSIKEPYLQGKRTESSDGETIVFKPSNPLEYSTTYGIIIKDSSERCLAKWWFTTASSNITKTASGITTMVKEKEITNVKVIAVKSHDGNSFDRALDSDLNTRWSNYGKDSWIIFDLGSKRDLCAIDIGWFKGDKRIYEFELKYSEGENNEEHYQSIDPLSCRCEDNPLSFCSSGKTISPERYTFDKVSAQYVKIVVNGNTQNHWASITEVAFYEYVNFSSS